MPVLNRKGTCGGDKLDDPPPGAEDLVAETYISPQLSLREGKHCGRPSGAGASHELQLRQVNNGHRLFWQ